MVGFSSSQKVVARSIIGAPKPPACHSTMHCHLFETNHDILSTYIPIPPFRNIINHLLTYLFITRTN